MILVVNAGSSSVKVALFAPDLGRVLAGAATEIGGSSAALNIDGEARDLTMDDHATALEAILDALEARGYKAEALSGAGHRVVHGGTAQRGPARITSDTRRAIADATPLAPLHNPPALDAIDALVRIAPGLPQVASFDTAFHATNPDVATRYALPARPETAALRRYGFHGISYAGLTTEIARRHGGRAPARLLACHLGNGASLCAIKNGVSVATTMGYSPLSGLTMGTRSGDIDGNAVLSLAKRLGADAAGRLLNSDSGLLGLGGASDMRALHAAGSSEADFAIRHFAYWCVRHAGSMIAALGGLDAVAFTGG
ncbi:MAG: acetate kinase, partial [Pseudomonadota bacterium]